MGLECNLLKFFFCKSWARPHYEGLWLPSGPNIYHVNKFNCEAKLFKFWLKSNIDYLFLLHLRDPASVEHRKNLLLSKFDIFPCLSMRFKHEYKRTWCNP